MMIRLIQISAMTAAVALTLSAKAADSSTVLATCGSGFTVSFEPGDAPGTALIKSSTASLGERFEITVDSLNEIQLQSHKQINFTGRGFWIEPGFAGRTSTRFTHGFTINQGQSDNFARLGIGVNRHLNSLMLQCDLQNYEELKTLLGQ